MVRDSLVYLFMQLVDHHSGAPVQWFPICGGQPPRWPVVQLRDQFRLLGAWPVVQLRTCFFILCVCLQNTCLLRVLHTVHGHHSILIIYKNGFIHPLP